MITIYTDRVKAGSAGVNYGPITLIRPKYKDDYGLHQHEYVHYLQWLLPTILGCVIGGMLYLGDFPYFWHVGVVIACVHPLLYMLYKPYRLHCEVEAYQTQALHYPDDRKRLFASYISKDYGLNITPEEAYKELLK